MSGVLRRPVSPACRVSVRVCVPSGSLSETAVPLLLLAQFEVCVGQDAAQRAGDAQALVDGQRLVEQNVTSEQRDAELKVTKHVVAVSTSG